MNLVADDYTKKLIRMKEIHTLAWFKTKLYVSRLF